MADSVLYSWGWGKYGQLGHGDEKNHWSPVEVDRASLLGKSVIQISCGFNYVAAVTSDKNVYTWGYGLDGQLGHGDTRSILVPRRVRALQKQGIKMVICGSRHTLAVDGEGKVYSWGSGDFGILGHEEQKAEYVPRVIDAFFTAGVSIKLVACGQQHSLALTDSGTLFSWGHGKDGRLGHNNEQDVSIPTIIRGIEDRVVRAIACGSKHSLAIDKKGELFSWGCGSDGQLGHGSKTSMLVPHKVNPANSRRMSRPGRQNIQASVMFDKILQVAAGAKHSLALAATGEVFAWGRSDLGRLGLLESFAEENNPAPVLVPTLVDALVGHRVCLISAGAYHSAALTDAGRVFSWGAGEYGRLGHGDQQDVGVPKLVDSLANKSVRHVECGAYMTTTLADESAVHSSRWCRFM
eukprot:GILK01009499.1.p1 GENE.GILK01009499.1~~GILK01009499.1.p1  ORF type:complete len:421 (-),score=31.77 GILK01009499.1:152-1375(-)